MTDTDVTWTPSIGLLANQAFSGSRWKGVDAWRAAAEAGAEWISVTEEAHGMPEERRRQLREDAEKAGTPILITGCHAFGLSDPRDAVREFNLEWAKRQLDLTVELGARRMKVLLGEWVWRGMWPNALQWQLEVDTLRELCAYAERRGTVLSIELEPLENSFVNDPHSLARMLADVGSPALLANVDTSHMVVRGTPASELGQLAGRVDSIDFSDSNGKFHEHLAPGTGVADLAAFAGELVADVRGRDALLAVEVGPFNEPDRAYDLVRASVTATRELFTGARDPRSGGDGGSGPRTDGGGTPNRTDGGGTPNRTDGGGTPNRTGGGDDARDRADGGDDARDRADGGGEPRADGGRG
ncbi:sugar phosphate isomerase/epimerase family protein [Streptomyces sp. NPDC056632]|uniref:sugar phosphate isomerase/epimerase family protein n=1 Tax=Streptomyces sp. NPDC056632 TaxID=3345884 RepID=UPI0036BA67CF